MRVLFGLDFENDIVYLKQAPSNLSNCKISFNNENAYIWDQKCPICVLLATI